MSEVTPIFKKFPTSKDAREQRLNSRREGIKIIWKENFGNVNYNVLYSRSVREIFVPEFSKEFRYLERTRVRKGMFPKRQRTMATRNLNSFHIKQWKMLCVSKNRGFVVWQAFAIIFVSDLIENHHFLKIIISPI